MAMLTVKGSPKTRIPTATAVTGSIAPSTEVMVEPIRLIAAMSDKLEIMVGMMANKSRLYPASIDGILCRSPSKDTPHVRNMEPIRNT